MLWPIVLLWLYYDCAFSLGFIVKYFNVIVLLESSNILCNHLCTLTTSTSSWSWPSNGSMEGEVNYYYYYYTWNWIVVIVKVKVKGTVHTRAGHKGPGIEYRCSSTLSLASALDGSGWSTPRPGHWYLCIGGWMGPRTSVDGAENLFPT
jgi:hypothetical protein